MSIKARQWVAVQFGGSEALRSIEVDVPEPKRGHVTVHVRGIGMNPADAKHIAPGQDPELLPLSIGYEVAGIVTALGPGTELASGGGAVGDIFIGASNPESGPFRARTRGRILDLAQRGDLVVPLAAKLLTPCTVDV